MNRPQTLFLVCLTLMAQRWNAQKVLLYGGDEAKTFLGCLSCGKFAFSVKIPNGSSFNYLDYSGTFIDARHVNGTITVRNNPSSVTALDLTRID